MQIVLSFHLITSPSRNYLVDVTIEKGAEKSEIPRILDTPLKPPVPAGHGLMWEEFSDGEEEKDLCVKRQV